MRYVLVRRSDGKFYKKGEHYSGGRGYRWVDSINDAKLFTTLGGPRMTSVAWPYVPEHIKKKLHKMTVEDYRDEMRNFFDANFFIITVNISK